MHAGALRPLKFIPLGHKGDIVDILHHNGDGYVAACRACGRFQVAFGTLLMELEEGMVRDLKDELERDIANCGGRVDPRRKIFTYRVLLEDVRLVFNYAEVEQLHRMLSDSLWIHGIFGRVRTEHEENDH